jgi:hypothetical protein
VVTSAAIGWAVLAAPMIGSHLARRAISESKATDMVLMAPGC